MKWFHVKCHKCSSKSYSMFWFLKLKLLKPYSIILFSIVVCLLSDAALWHLSLRVKTLSLHRAMLSHPLVLRHIQWFFKGFKSRLLFIITRKWIFKSHLYEGWSSQDWINFQIAKIKPLLVTKRILDNWSVTIFHSSQCKLLVENQKIKRNRLVTAHV